MKRVLLFAGLAVIAAVLAYSLQPRESGRMAMSFTRLSKVANDLAMIKPKLHGTDASGDPFVITADRAMQEGPSVKRARLINVQADITLKKGLWISASARTGYLDVEKNLLRLEGDLSVYASNGYELHAPSALINLQSGLVRGDQSVNGQGPGGTLRADRFEVNRSTKQIHLMGHVHMTFFRHGAKS